MLTFWSSCERHRHGLVSAVAFFTGDTRDAVPFKSNYVCMRPSCFRVEPSDKPSTFVREHVCFMFHCNLGRFNARSQRVSRSDCSTRARDVPYSNLYLRSRSRHFIYKETQNPKRAGPRNPLDLKFFKFEKSCACIITQLSRMRCPTRHSFNSTRQQSGNFWSTMEQS